MLNLWRYLSGVRGHYEDIGVAVETVLQKHAITKNELQVTRRKLDELREKIGSSERADAADLEKHRHQIERKIIKLEEEQAQIREELVVLRDDRERLLQQRKDIEREQGIRDEMSKRAALAAATNDAFKKIHEDFTGETRDLIGTTATRYFRQLLDDEGNKTLRDIVVAQDYSIQVYDRWKKPFLANISAGQRQIMSIAFIAALAKAAAGADVFEMPLFMDTPFGRLHENNGAAEWTSIFHSLTKPQRKVLYDIHADGRVTEDHFTRTKSPRFRRLLEHYIEADRIEAARRT